MNIFEALRADHETQRALVRELVATSGDSEERRACFTRLQAQLDVHAIAEERHFYVPLMKADLTQEPARHGVAEHHELDELVKTLVETEMSSSSWLAIAQKLKEKVLHHLEEEEHKIFQLAGKVLSDAQKTDLADAYRREMDERLNAADG